MNEFTGSWVRRGGVFVPVLEPAPPKQRCRVCGGYARTGLCAPCKESTLERVHGSHAGHAQHVRRNESPCASCESAEKVYQNKRYRRGQLSKVDREWATRAAVKGSWVMDERTNRMLGSLTLREENHHERGL